MPSRPTKTGRLALSVVVPCFNEAQGLPLFVERMMAAAQAVARGSYELVLVNDGSRDATWEVIRGLTARHPAVVGINLTRNHGHQLAVTAGLSLSRGARVLIIDADLQDPPELLPDMMARMDEGYDVVYGRRRTRTDESRFKVATAAMFYRLLGRLSEVDIPVDTGDFRLMSRRIVDRLNAMPEHDRYLRGMVAWLGGAQAELLYDRDPRHAGETGYTLRKMLRLAVNGVTSFSTAPLKAALVLATVGIFIAAGILIYALIGFFTGSVQPGWTSLALIMVFFGISQLGCLAIIGAYVGRTYMQLKGRPLFLIDEIATQAPASPAGRAPAKHPPAARAKTPRRWAG
ncbi:glycosyltransferase family 2 protein [Phenylobacterium sp.]|uniref:glycosyltransferase family 2 protein n=1 Tax=Phenylobacterium sp. TaxID=1871053 RepID=UPI0035627775